MGWQRTTEVRYGSHRRGLDQDLDAIPPRQHRIEVFIFQGVNIIRMVLRLRFHRKVHHPSVFIGQEPRNVLPVFLYFLVLAIFRKAR